MMISNNASFSNGIHNEGASRGVMVCGLDEQAIVSEPNFDGIVYITELVLN